MSKAQRRQAPRRAVATTATATVWMNAHQAGEYIGVAEEFIRQMARMGRLRGFKVKGTGHGVRELWRFRASDLDKFMEQGARSVA